MSIQVHDHSDLIDALRYIDPASLSYQEWVNVGMALHDSGLSAEVWDDWSREDIGRYVQGDCFRKWKGFGNSEKRITSGTIVKMAEERGWVSPYDMRGRGRALAWDEVIPVTPDVIVRPEYLDPEEIPTTRTKTPNEELIAYLSALFEADDCVGFVSDSAHRGDKYVPANKGAYSYSASYLINQLQKFPTIDEAIGAYDHAAGAWIRFNPLSGDGVKNTDVTDFRYALVESDTLSKEMQLAAIRELNLPCAAIVDSGGKSIHAIGRVDARDYAEYRERVDKLYSICRKNGLEPDTQNKNPSRLSRMPGCERSGNHQSLIDTNTGKKSWVEWLEWVQETTDELPEFENLSDVWNNMPDLSSALIADVLRQGHKLLLAGPSKAGKSLALIELCIAIAEGKKWLVWDCAPGRVLYVNLELDSASCMHRFKDVYSAMGLSPDHISNIDIWNLRGRSVPMDKLTPSLVRRALKTRPTAVVIDPIYKVITGDENSADAMAAFCNQFDKVAQQIGCSVIYCHHHSKGFQGQKRSMDRASGSGVFARDADALLDVVQLELTDEAREQKDKDECWRAITAILDSRMPKWRENIPEEVKCTPARFIDWARANLDGGLYNALYEAFQSATERVKNSSAWRIEGTLREFPSFEPVNLWFDYPVHTYDRLGVLQDLACEGEPPTPEARRQAWKKGAKKGREKAKSATKQKQEEKISIMREAIAACIEDGTAPTRSAVLEMINSMSDEPIKKEDLKNWTRNTAKWSPIRVNEQNELYDTENSPIEWDAEITV